MNTDLHTFVRDALARGVTRADIEKALRDARWPADEIAAELAAWADAPAIGLPVPRRRVGVSAREAFLYLLLFVALYLVAYHVGSIAFAWIERLMPDAAFRGGSFDGMIARSSEWVRFGVASLLVAFPVYLFTARLTGRAVAHDPEQRNSGVRRWLTYLTLFNAACVLIGDFIAVVLGLLKGELTGRFLSKATVVAAIAGWLFTHYMGGLNRDEGASVNARAPAWLARAAGVVVVLTIAAGLLFAGSPAGARRELLDQRRVQELDRVSQEVIQYHQTFSHMPENLELLSLLPGRGAARTVRDPVSGEPYAYVLLDSLSFELCATFDAPDSIGPYGPATDMFWRHGAGRACYTFRIPKRP